MRMCQKGILILCLAAAFAPVWGAELNVTSVTPKGEGARAGKAAVSVTFNQPVAALSEKSAFASADCPISISPAVPGTCRFSGTQTLQFEPSQEWQKATKYDVVLSGSFTSRVSGKTLGEDYNWSFATERPSVQNISPSENEQWIDLRPLIFVTVSQPVSLPSVQQAVSLTYQAPKPRSWWEELKARFTQTASDVQMQTVSVPFSVRELTDKEYEENFSWMNRERVFVLQPKEALLSDSKITLRISQALRGKEGNLGPAEDFESVFYTYPKLRVSGAALEGCLPFDGHVDFSSPVRLSELLKHVRVSPASALKEVTPQEAETLGYQRYEESEEGEEADQSVLRRGYFSMPFSFLTIRPKETVTLVIDKELKDIYGQRLGEEKTLQITNTGYCPAVSFKGGKGVMESYLPLRHPVDVLNEPSVEVSAARFNKATFIPFDQQDSRYCEETELPAAARQYKGSYTFQAPTDKTLKTYLDLKKFNPTAHNSVIYSQVRVPSKHRQSGYCWIGATDNITDLGVTMKTSRENILVWVTSLQDGTAQGNLNVELRDEANRTLWSGSTDENGLAFAPGTRELAPKARNRWSRPAVYAFVTSPGGDAVISSDWNDGLEPWRFNILYEYSPEETPAKTALFTDRGIYRPGETVYVKGLTRRRQNGQWALPAASKGELKVYNSRGDEMLKQTLSYGAQSGAFNGQFVLSADAPTGSWQLHFKPAGGEAEAYYSFQVEAVKQAEFEVNLRALEPAYLSGQTAQFTASAGYLFGAPVAGAKAKWTVRRSNGYFNPKGWDDYTFTPYFLNRDVQEKEGLLTEASGVLDAQGKVDFSVRLPAVSRLQDIYAELGVQAPSGQQLFARTSFTLNPASFYLGAKMDNGWRVELGETARVHVAAVSPSGEAVGPVKVLALIQKEEYYSIRKNGLAGRLEWVSERRLKDFPSQEFTVTDKGYDFAFTPSEPGSYQITLTAKDAQGRQVKGGFDFTAFGKGQAYWKQNDDDILQLKADQDVYLPGQTARILVQSPYENALALVSVEREGVLDAWTVPVSAGADYIEVPVKASYLPNVFVGVTLVRGRAEKPAYDKEGLDLAKPQGKTGYVNLSVSQQEREIKTLVSPAKENYRPGQEVVVKLDTSVRGKGAPADVTVMAVDEGVLALTGYKLPNLMDVFYSPASLSVGTADNRTFLVGQRNFGEKGENRGGGGGASAKLGGTDLRSRFEFTPYFNALVRTDNKGRAEVKFTLPDNLTTFRIMAVAATVREFGSAQADVKVSKPLMVSPKMPRFARRGDKFRCGAIVYNYEDEKGEITVSARAEGALSLGGGEQKVHVAKGEAKEVSWPCEAVQTGTAEAAFAARGEKESDGAVARLTVSDVEKKQTLALYSATDKTQEQVLERPASVNEKADNEVSVSLASTALLNLRGGMLYLLTYPYDCLEQKMSKILPVVEGAKLVEDFGLGDVSQYKQTVQNILNEIPNYQSSSGGLAYWPSSRPDPYVTAYALETAYRAQKAGYTVPQASLQKAVAYLKGVFGQKQQRAYPYSETENKTARAYATYVLALYGEKMNGQFNNLYASRNALSAPAQAYLLLAAQALNQDVSVKNALAQELLNQAVYGAQTLHFSSGKPQPWLHMGDVKVTALSLEALLNAGDYLQQPYQAVKWLTDQLNAKGHWSNTSSNAAVFSALNAYYRLKEAAEPKFKASVSLNGKNAYSAQFEGRSVQTRRVSWPLDQVYENGASVRLGLSKSGRGTLYYTLAQTYAPKAYADDVNAGFSVSRRVTDLQGRPAEQFKAAERYKVTLKAETSATHSFVVLEDFVPAGFEIVNTSLATESAEQASSLGNAAWGGFERDEKYDDRIAVFADYLTAGAHEYSYLIQASVPGAFSWPSLWAQEMYDPAVFGRNATAHAVIEP